MITVYTPFHTLILISVFDDKGSFEVSFNFGDVIWDANAPNTPRFVNINEAIKRAMDYTKKRCDLLSEIQGGKYFHSYCRLYTL